MEIQMGNDTSNLSLKFSDCAFTGWRASLWIAKWNQQEIGFEAWVLIYVQEGKCFKGITILPLLYHCCEHSIVVLNYNRKDTAFIGTVPITVEENATLANNYSFYSHCLEWILFNKLDHVWYTVVQNTNSDFCFGTCGSYAKIFQNSRKLWLYSFKIW